MTEMQLPQAPNYETLFSTTFEKAAIGIAHVAPDGRWIRMNQCLCDTVGYSREELQALSFQAITYHEDLDRDLGYVGQMLDGSLTSYQMEKRYVRKNGDVIWASLTVSLVRDAQGLPDFFISVVENIDARKQAEAELNLTRNELQVIFENLDGGLITANLAGDLQYWNRTARDMHGFSAAEDLEFNVADMLAVFELRLPNGHVLSFSDWPLMRILRGETLRGLELVLCRKDNGFRRLYRFRGSLALDNNGNAALALLIMTDAGYADF